MRVRARKSKAKKPPPKTPCDFRVVLPVQRVASVWIAFNVRAEYTTQAGESDVKKARCYEVGR